MSFQTGKYYSRSFPFSGNDDHNGMSLELRTVCDRCFDEETIPDPISLLHLSRGFVLLRCLMCVMDLGDTSQRTAGDQRHQIADMTL